MPRHPEPAEIRTLLAGLLDKQVSVSLVDRASADDMAPYLTGVYVGVDGETEVLSSSDVAFAAASGASLALIPPGQAAEWVTTRELPDDAVDNAAEVLNILAATLNDANPSRHVKMTSRWVEGDDEAAPDPVIVLGGPRRTAQYAVDIDGYPSGHLSLASR
jgi:hypothetical protein